MKWQEVLQTLVGRTITNIDLLEDETTLEITIQEGKIFRVWGIPQHDIYPELDFQIVDAELTHEQEDIICNHREDK